MSALLPVGRMEKTLEGCAWQTYIRGMSALCASVTVRLMNVKQSSLAAILDSTAQSLV